MAKPLDLGTWLREQCADFRFDVGGVFQRNSDVSWWPLAAAGPVELEERLVRGGHLLPLPKEPAALANVLEVSIVNFLVAACRTIGEAVRRGTERGYPDLEISGERSAVASMPLMSRQPGERERAQTQSRITLYTGNTYFKWPDLHWPGTFRPSTTTRATST